MGQVPTGSPNVFTTASHGRSRKVQPILAEALVILSTCTADLSRALMGVCKRGPARNPPAPPHTSQCTWGHSRWRLNRGEPRSLVTSCSPKGGSCNSAAAPEAERHSKEGESSRHHVAHAVSPASLEFPSDPGSAGGWGPILSTSPM